MKALYHYTLLAGAILPAAASAQLINVGPAGAAFNSIVTAFASDGPGLYVGPGEANASLFDKFYWDSSESEWVTGSYSNDVSDSNFMRVAVNQESFLSNGPLDIGFIANENKDFNQLFVSAKSGPTSERLSLFNYSDASGSLDEPPAAKSVTLEAGVVGPLAFTFDHVNHTTGPGTPVLQEEELRFTMFQSVLVSGGVVTNAGLGTEWIFGISDRDQGFDNDGDDGYFYIAGTISPVPEPSQIAALALLGMGGFLFIRRKFLSKQQK
jgi:hypothetical protein